MTNIPIDPPVDHQQTAEEILNIIRQAVQKIEGFAHATVRQRRKTGATASLTDEALIAIAAVCDLHPNLAATCDLTSAEIRQSLGFSQAYSPIADEFPMLRSGVKYTINERRASVARRARRLYRMVKSLNDPDELLVPHIATLQAAFKRKRATVPVSPDPNAPPADVPAGKKK